MDKYPEIVGLLHSNNVDYREHGDELITHCLFNDCDADSRGLEAHFYINKNTGLYDCKKCGEKGNLVTLRQRFGIEKPIRTPKVQNLNKLAEKCHANLPDPIREYLRTERLLNDQIITDYQLGYLEQNGERWITIPVTDMIGNVLFLKLRRDPFQSDDSQSKYKSTGGAASIYNAQILKSKPEMLVLCEGEFDCLVLTTLGIPAICSTAGANTFKDDWITQLDFVREFYVLFDNYEAGLTGAKSLTEKLAFAHPNSSIMLVSLPSEVNEHGDVTDFFRNQIGNPDDLFEPTGKYVSLSAGIEPINVAELSEITLKDVAETLSLTIKRDNDNKIVTFLCMLSAYTDSSQINVSFNAPSSSGKTYLATEVAKLFPAADKIELSGASPTSFFHGEGVHDKERDAKIVSLERKILLNYEQPDPQLQQKLRAVLSHDQRELNYRITNKDKKGANRAELIIIRGYPATVFCSAGLRLDEQEMTRAILLSPEVSTEKLQDGIHLQAQRGANEVKFEARIESQPERIALKNRILAIKREQVGDIIIANPSDIEERFHKRFSKLKARHMRDMGHLMKLIKAVTLLNVWQRRQPDGTIVASQTDIDQAFELWERFIESQDLNVPPMVLDFYKRYIVPAYNEKKSNPEYMGAMISDLMGLSRQELSDYHLRIEKYPVNDEQLRKQILPQLESSGLITQNKPKEGDKRSPHIFPKLPLTDEDNPSNQNNVGTGGGLEDIENWEEIKTMFFG